MKSTRPRTPLRLKGATFALSVVAMATQVGDATPAQKMAAEPAHHVTAALIPWPSGRELQGWFGWLTGALSGPPVSGSWVLVAGLAGVLTIGRRRMSATGSLALDPNRSRRG